MISFDIDRHRFHLRAAAVVVHETRVLLHRLQGDAFWSVPGGRVEAGEVAADTVVREMQEELAEPVSCGRMLWVAENFFTYRGVQHHEIGMYFEVRLDGGSRLLASRGPFIGEEGGVPLCFDWFERAQLANLDIRPSFLAGVLAAPEQAFRHLVHHETADHRSPGRPKNDCTPSGGLAQPGLGAMS